jgi:PAS domain S-box-containing protein
MEKLTAQTIEISELKARLAEAEDTLNAIRGGEVDALVASGPNGDQVFTLQGAEMPYRILVEEMNQGALLLIPDGTILYANTQFARLAKTPLEQVIGSAWQQFFPRDKHLQLEGLLKTTEPVTPSEALNLMAADGSSCPVQLALRSMHSAGVEGFSVILTDLSERQRSEDALRKISVELLEKNGDLNAFSHSVSHDMRAPLRTMQGFARVLLEDYASQLDPKAKTYLSQIETSAERLSRLINDVLSYSQLSQVQNQPGTFELARLLRDIVETYPNLREANIEILPFHALVRGYEVALSQCISNLLGNALKFIPQGVTPRIKVWAERSKGHWRLWVQDNGIGIARKDQGRIFDAFSRLHSHEVYEGSGLGLSMVKKAVEKMGGRVGVESELGQGSRFWVEVPIA